VRYVAAWQEWGNMYVQLEFCNAGNLENWMEKNHNTGIYFCEAELKTQLQHLASGLNFMHETGLAHLDIKPNNIFVHIPGEVFNQTEYNQQVNDYNSSMPYNAQECIVRNFPVYKLGDFGFVHWADTKVVSGVDTVDDQGTGVFKGPERMEKEIAPDSPLSCSDIYALGLSIYHSGTNDYQYREGSNQNRRIDSPLYYPITAGMPQCSDEFNECIRQMMSYHPKDRPTARLLLNNPIINAKLRRELQLSEELLEGVFGDGVESSSDDDADNHNRGRRTSF